MNLKRFEIERELYARVGKKICDVLFSQEGVNAEINDARQHIDGIIDQMAEPLEAVA